MRPGALFLLCAAFMLAACGDEADSPLDWGGGGKGDSWRNPTDHQTLHMGVDAVGELTDGTLFHAWTFTLTDEATVTLYVESDDVNLDTMMYLYRRDVGADNWGSHKFKNDDSGGSLKSRLSKRLNAGEYRVKVRGAKTPFRGRFVLKSSCSGAGCPSVPPEAEGRLPEPSGFASSCVAKLEAVMKDVVVSEQKHTTSAADRLLLDRLPSLAVGYYLSYWKTHMGWDDEMIGQVEEEIYVRDARLSGGAAIIQVDFSGYVGETSVAFVFDAQGKLVHLSNYGEAEHLLWFCKDTTEQATTAPDERFMIEYIMLAPRKASAIKSQSGQLVAGQDGTYPDLDGEVEVLLEYFYMSDAGVSAGTAVSFELETWDEYISWNELEPAHALRVTFSATGHPTISYMTGGEESDSTVFVKTDATGSTFSGQGL